MRNSFSMAAVLASAFSVACAAPQGATSSATPPEQSASGPFVSPDLPVLSGQTATCAGPREKTFNLEAREVTVDLGMGMKFNAWTYNGRLPGPVLEACEGDHVKIVLGNHTQT